MSERRYFLVSLYDKGYDGYVFGFLSVLLAGFFDKVRVNELNTFEVDEEYKK